MACRKGWLVLRKAPVPNRVHTEKRKRGPAEIGIGPRNENDKFEKEKQRITPAKTLTQSETTHEYENEPKSP